MNDTTVLKVFLSIFVFIMSAMTIVFLLTGCATSLMSREPVTQSVTLPGTPQETYIHAARTLAKMGAQIQVADPQTRMITSIVHGAVQLNVTIDETSVVHLTCQLLPGKLVVGSVTECADLAAQLQERHAHVR